MNMMKFVKEQRENIREYAKKKDLEKEFQRNKAMKELVKESEKLKAETESA